MDKQKQCKKCGWKWEARKKDPAQCPRCKRYDWDILLEKDNMEDEKYGFDEQDRLVAVEQDKGVPK